MGWLQKQPQVGQTIQLYTIGQTRTVLVVGLGNTGRTYANTRHNVGFLCIDAFVASHEQMTPWQIKKSLKSHVSTGRLGDTLVVAVKPTTDMNRSGEAVSAVSQFYKLTLDNIVVVHDELDIPFGQIRMRLGGTSAGHNGIKSVTNALGEMYGRIRVGIGPKKPASIDSADFVLRSFNSSEKPELPQLAREVVAILSEYAYGGQLLHETRTFLF